MSTHKRVHAGIPTGGQFASLDRPEPAFNLEPARPLRPEQTPVGYGLMAANLRFDAVASVSETVGGCIIRLKETHPRGGYDSIRVTQGTHRFSTAFTKAGALHRLDDFALDLGSDPSGSVDFSAWVDGYHQPDPDPEFGFSNFRREGEVNYWSGGNNEVEHDTNPTTGHMQFKRDGDIHRDGAPALFEAGKEPQWFSHGTPLPSPVPEPPTPIVGSGKTVMQGGNFEPDETLGDTVKKMQKQFDLGRRLGWITGPVNVRRTGAKIQVDATLDVEADRVRAVADSYNSYVAGNPAERVYDRKIAIIIA